MSRCLGDARILVFKTSAKVRKTCQVVFKTPTRLTYIGVKRYFYLCSSSIYCRLLADVLPPHLCPLGVVSQKCSPRLENVFKYGNNEVKMSRRLGDARRLVFKSV